MVLLVAATLAIQEKLDKYNAHLNRPLRQHVDLDWMDHCTQKISEVEKAQLVWKDLPGSVHTWLRLSSLTMLIGCHIFYWMDAACFKAFAVTDDINELEINTSERSFIQPMGYLGLALFF